MKRLLIILSLTLVSLMANAKAPQISVEQVFDGRYNNEKTVRISILKDNGIYFRILHVADNPAIVNKIEALLIKDKTNATNFFEMTGEGGKSIIVKLTNNGEIINIGFEQDLSGKSATLFIKGPEKAFK